MNIGEAVRERIVELCRERSISINKLSSMSGVTQSTVNNIVSGRNNSATISTIKKICDGLGLTIEDFFDSDLFGGRCKTFSVPASRSFGGPAYLYRPQPVSTPTSCSG